MFPIIGEQCLELATSTQAVLGNQQDAELPRKSVPEVLHVPECPRSYPQLCR